MRPRPRWMFVLAALAAMTGLVAGPAQASAPARPAAPRLTANTNASCNATPEPGHARCFAVVRTPASHAIIAAAAQDGPALTALTPADIRVAYHLPATGAGETVAIVDAFGDSSAESDLATFRSFFGLPACTAASGCFRKVDQSGGTSYPPDDPGWGLETSLDLDAVSSACPACNILLVEGNSASVPDLSAAENEAVTLGAKFISNSYGTNEDPGLLSFASAYEHPGVAITVSSGDAGNIVEWPSSDPDVTSAGGTTLARDAGSARGWGETAWDSGGSGCSTIEPQPAYQLGVTTGCAMRATADVSADADPATGLAVFDTLGSGGWLQVGGTSLAAPLITSMYALAGVPVPGTSPVNYPYHDPAEAADLFDVTQGSNGGCGDLLCNAGTGWDGPTGLGSPDGVGALSGGPQGQVTGHVTDATTGKPVPGAEVAADPGDYVTRTDSSGDYTLDVTAGTYTVSATMYAFQTGTSSGVHVAANGTAAADFSLAELPHATVSGTVSDGSGQGWPLYAKITIGGGYPGGPVYTNPFTGRYSVVLAGPATYPVQVTSAEPDVLGASGNGYLPQDAELAAGTSAVTKDITLQVDTAACSAPGYGPAGLSEDFAGWTGGAPGPGWTVSGSKAGWRFDNPGDRPAPGDNLASDQFAIADSGAGGRSGGRLDTTLTSPAVDLSGQSAPVVSFTSGYYGGSGQRAEIDLSTDGRRWAPVWQQRGGDAVGPVSVPIPQAAGKSGARVRFRYRGDDAWWWAIGNILVGTPGCVPLAGGLVTGIVRDGGSGLPVDGATVTSSGGVTGVAAGTTDQAVSGGLYEVFSPAGSQRFTASAAGYQSASAAVQVADGQLTRQDFSLNAKAAARRAGAVRPASAAAGVPAPGAAGGSSALKPLSLPGLRGKSYAITLITGDQVRLTAVGRGAYSVSAVPVPGSALRVSALAGKRGISSFQAIPAGAAALIASGALDRGLFDLGWLIRHGDTGPKADLAVVLRYAGQLGAARLARRAGGLPGVTVTSVSAAARTVRVSVSARRAVAFWTAITGRSAAARPGFAASSLAGGLTRVWLAGHREGPAVQPADSGQQLYTVTETVQGSADRSRWCSPADSLCLTDTFSLFGITGQGADQAYVATSVTCATSASPCTAYQATYSVPVGTYMSSGFADFKIGPDLQELDLTDPQVTVAGDTSFTLDAGTEQKITISTPRPSFPVAAATEDYRMTPDGTIDSNLEFVGYGSQNLWLIPSQPVTVGAFDASSSWILYAPNLAMSVVAPSRLTLSPEYPFYTAFPGGPVTPFTGSQTLPVVDAGIGGAADFSAIDARGKLALIHLDPVIGGCLVESSQLQNALQAGAAGVLVDPALPPSVGTGSCSLPVVAASSFGIGSQVDLPFAAVPAAQAAALEGLLGRGGVRIHVTALASSPYQYDLKFYSEGTMPADTAYRVTRRSLTAVSTRYHSDQPVLIQPSDTAFAPDEFFVDGVGDNVPGPGTQTAYYGPASPAVAWFREPAVISDGSTIAQPETWDVFSQRGGSRSEDWFDAPAALGSVEAPSNVFAAQPGKFDGAFAAVAACAGCRQGDVFWPLFYNVSGADPRLIDGAYSFAPGDIHLYQGGQEIQPIDAGGLAAYQLPAPSARYRLTASFANTSTTWGFTSGEPARNQVPDGFGCAGSALTGSADPCEPDPLIFLRYNAFTTVANTVSAGATHVIEVTPGYQAAVAPARITSLALWISTDGGTTWQPEKVRSRGGSYVASYRLPALAATGGSVSVMVRATDSAGDTVSQTSTDAYTISG